MSSIGERESLNTNLSVDKIIASNEDIYTGRAETQMRTEITWGWRKTEPPVNTVVRPSY